MPQRFILAEVVPIHAFLLYYLSRSKCGRKKYAQSKSTSTNKMSILPFT